MAGPEPVVVLICTDPRVSHRAFEAMRIGTGVVAGENAVTFVLAGAGVHLLNEDTEELVDGDEIARFRATLRGLGVAFHVEETAVPSDPAWNADASLIVPVSRDRIGALMRGAGRTLIF
ncbi:MAG: hypothetical protein ACREJV_07885 [Candidatus Rokuibacteriota bacterium]